MKGFLGAIYLAISCSEAQIIAMASRSGLFDGRLFGVWWWRYGELDSFAAAGWRRRIVRGSGAWSYFHQSYECYHLSDLRTR